MLYNFQMEFRDVYTISIDSFHVKIYFDIST